MKAPTLKFQDYTCKAFLRSYPNGRPAIELVDAEDGSPILVPTVNLIDIDISPGFTFVRLNGIYAGAFDALENAGLIDPTNAVFDVGFCQKDARLVAVIPSAFEV